MKTRTGLTLIEVLVAILIMGVGLLAVMTLFPLGLLNYGQAMQDDRVAQAAANAAAIANAMDLRHDVNIIAAFPGGAPNAVYLDPWYAQIGQATLANVIPRKGVRFPQQANPGWVVWPQPYQQWFSLLDDRTFTEDGLPEGTQVPPPNPRTLGSVNRNAGYYSWSYMLRRQQIGDAFFTDMAIVVYKGRETDVANGETLYQSAGNQAVIGPASWAHFGVPIPMWSNTTIRFQAPWGNNTVLVRPGGNQIPIRKTGWILDPTTAQFYRVVNIVQNTGSPTLLPSPPFQPGTTVNTGDYVLETQTPLRAPQGNSDYTVTSILVMENVAEVIEKGFGWEP